MDDKTEPEHQDDTFDVKPVAGDRDSSQPNHHAGLHTSAETSPLSPNCSPAPLRWGEVGGVIGLIVLCDLTIYRGHGFAGYALLFLTAPILLWLGSERRCRGTAFWIVSTMLAALAGKLIWCGSGSLVAIGFSLIVAFSMALVGVRPYVLEAFFFAMQTFLAGFLGIIQFGLRIKRLDPVPSRGGWFNVILPLLALLVFGCIFIFANPDLADWFGEGIRQTIDALRDWLHQFAPDLGEAFFWLAVLWVVLGLLRPVLDLSKMASSQKSADTPGTTATIDAPLYSAFRNTLVTVIVLFAVYLVFEFKTLWFRDFPSGFHYSGYAHEGAGWLTAALALATVTLSMVFQSSILRDPRIRSLRRLAWLWSIENLLLAAAVYNRLFIYIGFNGMSRMRIVALFGMSTVVVGFILVVWKIVYNRNFLWIFRRHLWTFAIALYLLALTPTDTIVVGYNVGRILDGDPAPSVQISVHPINAEGILMLEPLLECDNEIIREGVLALLAKHHSEAESTATSRSTLGWTTYQIADRIALEAFRKNSARWKRYAETETRQPALKRFHDYAYQWY